MTPAAAPRRHIIISGTGRAGTSLLVHLLSHAGLDTGFTPEQCATLLDPHAHAGLEHDLRQVGAPRIVKSPFLCLHLDEVLARGDVVIEHALVPVRRLDDAAASRIRVQGAAEAAGRDPNAPGGLWDTHDPSAQAGVLANHLATLLYTLALHRVPTRLIAFPRLARDREYCVEVLGPVFPEVSPARLAAAFDAVVRPELIHLP